MQSLKTNGDSLAQEFYSIMNKGSSNKITKSAGASESDAVNMLEEDMAMSNEDLSDDLTNQIADMLMDDAGSEESLVEDDLADAVNDLDEYDDAMDKEARIISGLSKIAASLRGKNESFAADVVEATALSIKDDLRKEASRKSHMFSELNKIASDLSNSGDELAADMVRVTISRIKNS
jgi:hypothetical protein